MGLDRLMFRYKIAFFKKVSLIDNNLKKLPMIPKEYKPKYKIIKKLRSSKEEILQNNRARSAKLTVIKNIEGE